MKGELQNQIPTLLEYKKNRDHQCRQQDSQWPFGQSAQSNQAVQRFFTADSWPLRRQHWEEYKQLSLAIGRELGVSAELPTSLSSQYFVKALGAGNETGLVLDESLPVQAQTLGSLGVPWQVAEKGLSVD